MKCKSPIKLNAKISEEIYKVTAKLDHMRDGDDLYNEASLMLKTSEHEIKLLRRVIYNWERKLKSIQNSNESWGNAALYTQVERALKQKEEC